MNDKIVVFIDLWFLHFGISKFLKEKWDGEIYAILDVEEKARKFFEKQKIVNFQKVWYYLDHVSKNTKVDYDNQAIKTLIEKGKVDTDFLKSLENMCNRLDMNCMAVLSVMHYETGGSFRPDIKNPNSSATGLIQFMRSTAKKLETTTEDLSKMNQVEQLEYVEKYFNLIKDNFDEVDYLNPKNVALAVFYPRAIGQGDNYIIAEEGRSRLDDRILKVNKDHNGDGKITADEYTGKSLGLGYLR